MHKPSDVQIQEILEEENFVHYFVDEEGESPVKDQQPATNLDHANERYFSRFLRLPQQVVKPRRSIEDPRIDYSKSHVLTSNQHIQNVEVLANKKAKALEKQREEKKKWRLQKGREGKKMLSRMSSSLQNK